MNNFRLPTKPNSSSYVTRIYTSADNQIEAEVGESFVIELEGNPTTGYKWELQFDTGAIKSVGREYKPGGEGIGAGGRERFTLQAIKHGDSVIRAVYRRPWEHESIEERKFKIHVDK